MKAFQPLRNSTPERRMRGSYQMLIALRASPAASFFWPSHRLDCATSNALESSFITERFSGMQSCGPLGRQISEEQARRAGYYERQQHGEPRHRNSNSPQVGDATDHGIEADHVIDDDRNRNCNHDSNECSRAAYKQSFHQKLKQDRVTARANRFANPDLTRSLRHRHQHDVHDPHAANRKSDQSDQNQ
jgi:hypothetical protein